MPDTIMAVPSNENAPFRSYGVGYFLHYFLYISAYARAGGGANRSRANQTNQTNQTNQPTNQPNQTKPNQTVENTLTNA